PAREVGRAQIETEVGLALTGLRCCDAIQPRAPRRTTITSLLLLPVSALKVAYVGSSPWANVLRPLQGFKIGLRNESTLNFTLEGFIDWPRVQFHALTRLND